MNNSSQDIPMEQMPPMDIQPQMGNDMGGDFMPQGDMIQQPPMGGVPNEFDTNFDPGVEANEEEDPKKFIQQLTGKLSQSLRKYNDNNGQPDIDLNKYVAGMIAKQAMKGLSQDDADEIIDKIKADEDFTINNGDNNQQMPMDNSQMMNNGEQGMEMPQGQQQPNECFSRNRGTQIKEIVNSVLDKEKEKIPYQETPKKDRNSFRKKPFSSPNFKN